ncbi:MAG TPA: serine hydrolase domain-containing protein [Pyrinomonadaceae bacterium]
MNKKLFVGSIFGLTAAGAAYAWYRSTHQDEALKNFKIHGFVSPGFERVRDAFIENFTKRRELGGACCVYRNGEKIVDLWGGFRNKGTADPWEEDTMVVVYSTTKGLAAMAMALAHSRGLIDYDELVCKYWPEFAQNGKEKITVRQLLAHQAGLFAFDEPVDKNTVADPDLLAEIMARQKPVWEPGSRQAYHAISLGFYESELIRRVDPQHRTLGQFFQDEIATPLGLNLYIRLPESIPNSRLAVMTPVGFLQLLSGFPLRLALATFNHHSNIYRALVVNPGSAIVLDEKTIYARNLEVPSGGGVGTAQAIAKAYGIFASGGRELGLKKETLDELAAPPVPPLRGFYDECMLAEAKFSLGFIKRSETMPLPTASAFGHPGAGGSMGFADPENGIGYAYVTNRMGTELMGDPRDLALREAVYSALRSVKTTERSLTAAA